MISNAVLYHNLWKNKMLGYNRRKTYMVIIVDQLLSVKITLFLF